MVTIKTTHQQHTTVDDEVHLATVAHTAVWLPVCMPVYMPDD